MIDSILVGGGCNGYKDSFQPEEVRRGYLVPFDLNGETLYDNIIYVRTDEIQSGLRVWRPEVRNY